MHVCVPAEQVNIYTVPDTENWDISKPKKLFAMASVTGSRVCCHLASGQALGRWHCKGGKGLCFVVNLYSS